MDTFNTFGGRFEGETVQERGKNGVFERIRGAKCRGGGDIRGADFSNFPL